MPTMTTVQKMFEKADDLERQARVLREAIALMNGDLSERKEKRVGTTIEQALALRRQQRGRPEPQQARMIDPEEKATRIEQITRYITEAPRRSRDISNFLAEQGSPVGKDRVRQLLAEIPNVQRTGETTQTKWFIAAAAKKAAPKKKKKATPGKRYGAKVKVQRQASADFLALFPAGMVMTMADLKGQGADVDARRLLGPLRRRGYLATKGEGYIRTTKVFTP